MQKLLFICSVILLSIVWLGWGLKKEKYAVTSLETAIACLPMETQELYKEEASKAAFASLHPSPRKANQDRRLGKMIKFKAADGQDANAYFIASKKKSKKWLIVIQEWWGLNDNIKSEADKYYRDLTDMNILAVDMYDGKVATTPDSAMKIMRGANMNRMSSIITGAIGHAGPKASIYSVGWCFGGMWSLQTAILAGSQGKGSVMFYGRPENDLEKLKKIQCDVIGFFGNKDQSPSPAMVNEFGKNMETAGKKLTKYNYEAGHGFANPSNPNFNAEATADSYSKAIAFLKAH
jgi:carboxymethylenebutenolidase